MKKLFVKITITVLLLTVAIFSQEKLEARLVDEMGKPCSEDLLARYDGFLAELQNAPKSKGYIIFNGEISQEGTNIRFIDILKRHPKFRGFDENRVVFIRAENLKDMNIRFLLVSDRASPPKIENLYLNEKIVSPTMFQKTVAEFNDTYGNENEFFDEFSANWGCDFAPNLEDYAKVLLADENLTGYLIANISPEDDLKIVRFAYEKLVGKYKVPSERLQYSIGGNYSEDSQIELWFVPKGQSLPRGELVDDFANLGCDDILARVDGFISLLQQNPDSIGYVLSYGSRDKNLYILLREMLLKGQIKVRRFDKNRIKFIRGEEEIEVRNQLWIVPQNSELPEFSEIKYSFKLPEFGKPFKFTDENYEGYCPRDGYEESYLEVLKSNPNARGNMVIYAKSKQEFTVRKEELLKSLSEISQERLNFFYVKDNYLSTEYWIVPKKSRN